MGLESLIMDYLFLAGGSAADNACTYKAMKKNNQVDSESNLHTQDYIRKYGLGNGLLRQFGSAAVYLAAGTLVMYGIDRLFGIEDHIANFHHAFTYIVGTTKYIAAIHNVSVAYGYKMIPKAIEYIPYFFSVGLSRVTAKITGKKGFKEEHPKDLTK